MAEFVSKPKNDRNEFYEERAAIIEYDGGVDRVEAERLAKLDTLDHFTDYTLRRGIVKT